MKPRPIKPVRGPEGIIQSEIVKYLKVRDWLVLVTHGNLFQKGLPDLYVAHSLYGVRWIECKYHAAYSFTPAQREVFPALSSKGVGVWILTDATEDEYLKLFAPANWHQYLHELRPVSRPRLPRPEGYIPKYPTPGLKKKEQ
jgi:hypothetical protein